MIICILHELPNNANSSHKPTFFLGITTLFLSSLLLRVGQKFRKKASNFAVSNLLITGLQTETNLYFAARKRIQNLEGHDHWHCRRITF